MTNVIKLKPAEYVNVDGRPLNVTFKKIVTERCPDLKCAYKQTTGPDGETRDWYTVTDPAELNGWNVIGTGGTEEAAWRDAYFRIMESGDAGQ